MGRNTIAVLFLFVIGLFAFPPESALAREQPSSFSVMTYNVENLFDATHAIGKSDYTFLPLAIKYKRYLDDCQRLKFSVWRRQCHTWDWTDAVVEQKLTGLAQVIQSYNSPQGPDIVVLQEVENIVLLRRLARKLKSSHYQTMVLLENTDPRGIDIGLLSRFPKVGEAQQDYFRRFVRPALSVKLSIAGTTVHIIGVHFPSQIHSPQKARWQQMQWLKTLVEQRQNSTTTVIAAGDFNIPGGWQDSPQQRFFQFWQGFSVAHRDGCQGCDGTHYYRSKKQWSFLDSIIASRTGPWQLETGSVRVVRTEQNRMPKSGYPRRFQLLDKEKTTGVSDHFPLVASFVLRTEVPTGGRSQRNPTQTPSESSQDASGF